MGLRYRLNTQDDEPELIRLWSEHSGWDQVDSATWAHRLMHPPLGPAGIVVAEDDTSGRIMGQLAFIPSLLSLRGREVSALRLFAVVLAKELRGIPKLPNPFKHPLVQMYQKGTRLLRERGDALVYAVPDPRWMTFLRLIPFAKCSTFPLWSLPLPLAGPIPLPAGFTVGPHESWDERVDRLWSAASRLHGCLVVRNSRTLPWKIGSGDYTVTAVERGGELVGLVASRQKGDRQWLICDLLSVDSTDTLRATLTAACNLAHSQSVRAPSDQPIIKVAVLVTPVLRPAVEALGFERDAYDFPLAFHKLDRSIANRELASENWYVSAND